MRMKGVYLSMKMKVRNKAAFTDAVTALEETNKRTAYLAALEGIVLLENDGCLPVKPGKIALYGAGADMTIKGGTGSGEVNVRHAVSILEGLDLLLQVSHGSMSTGRFMRRPSRITKRSSEGSCFI